MSITSWMTLGLEERIKVPEGAFNISLSVHFVKTHFEQDLSELGSHFEQWV